MNTENLPIIDWAQAIKLAGNKSDLAQEMFKLLIISLPKDLGKIQGHYNNKNYTALLQEIHKLHGVLCYSGLPRLKLIVENLEHDLKQHVINNLSTQLVQLDKEINLLITHHISHN